VIQRWRQAHRRADDGSTAVELVLLAPVLLFMVFVIVQTALYMHARHVALAAAQQGARIARTTELTSPDGVAAARQGTVDYLQQLAGDVVTGQTVTISRTASTATVVVRVSAISILPGLHLVATERSSGPVENFVAATGSRP